MLSIKNSIYSALLLASYAAAAPQNSQSAINLEAKYCSKDNTGSSNDMGMNVYQSFGLCNDKCQGKFAYAVIQYQECYCSNDKPDDTVDLASCNQGCPGYPDQKCGNKGAGLYSYIPLDGAPVSSGDATSTTSSSSGSASSSSASSSSGNSTMPASTHGSSTATNGSSSASGHGSSTNGGGNSTTSSDAADATYTGAAASLAVPAAFGIVMSCALGLAL